MPGSSPRVSGDRIQLQQVFLNLFINSIEAMSREDESRRVLAICRQLDVLDALPAARVDVEDQGVGLGAGDSERCFEAFYTTKESGLGLGLRIGRSIVEAHGGRLWATYHEGPGATFHCLLPVLEAEGFHA
jgi:signal transduction histidine kinase